MNRYFRRSVLKMHEFGTGRHILQRLNELNCTQWLSCDELSELQRKKLINLVEYAYQYVPYYQRTFRDIGFEPGDLKEDLSCLRKLPILTKAIIRDNFENMQTTEAVRRKQLSLMSTSGSTGQPLIFMQDRDYRDAVTADIQRHIEWAGCELGDLQALIWGVGFKQTRWKKMRTNLIDSIWNRFQINAFTMTEETMDEFAKEVIQRKPKTLFGYATSIYRFAQFIRTNRYKDISFNGIFSSAELLLPPVRQFIEETFRCKIFNRYGTLELGGVACECEAHDGMHVSAENNYVEIIDHQRSCNPGEVGDIIVTNLNNLGMPFIRYSIGDDGAWYGDSPCSCGRQLPRLKSLEGRIVDTFQTADGRIVWSGFAGAAFRCLAHPSIRQFQVVQKSLDKIVVRLVKSGEVPESIQEQITDAIQYTFGQSISVEYEFPDEIPPLPSGKHQYAISEIGKSK